MSLLETLEIQDVPDLGPDERPPRRLTFKTAAEILEMEFDGTDNLFGDRLLTKGGSLVLQGVGGCGKSFLALQCAVSAILSRPFLGIETHIKGGKWLFFQQENSCRRLAHDLGRLRAWVNDPLAWQLVEGNLILHTLEADNDFCVNLENPEVFEACTAAVDQHSPSVIVFDPLKDFSLGNLNDDQDMGALCHTITSLTRRGDPNRAALALHHSRTGLAGAAGVSGYDKSSFGRNSKVLYAWSRAVINICPADPDNNDRLIVVNSKNNQGALFTPFGVKRDPQTLIFAPDSSFNVRAWETEFAGRKPKAIEIDPAGVAALVNGEPVSKRELVGAIIGEFGCAKSRAYAAVGDAEGKTIRREKKSGCYILIEREKPKYDPD